MRKKSFLRAFVPLWHNLKKYSSRLNILTDYQQQIILMLWWSLINLLRCVLLITWGKAALS